mgnify:CR=1 FL=1
MLATVPLLLASLLLSVSCYGELFTRSTNEVHFQYGKIHSPSFAGGLATDTRIITYQHANSWAYGSTFLFIDFIDDERRDDFNDSDYYGEFYLNFSLQKILGINPNIPNLNDISLVAGVNMGKDAKVRKYLPGLQFSWQVPGFAFLNTTSIFGLNLSKMKSDKSFGEIIKALREQKKLTLREVAEILEIDTSTLGKIEKNSRKPSKSVINKLADFYEVNEKDLAIASLSDAIAYKILSEENYGMEVLKVAEAKVKYLTKQKKSKS